MPEKKGPAGFEENKSEISDTLSSEKTIREIQEDLLANYPPGKWFREEISDTDFIRFRQDLILSLEKCDSNSVMNFLNDYVEVGQYGCSFTMGNDSVKPFLDSMGFYGCQREIAVQNILFRNQLFSVFCKQLLREITGFGIKPFHSNSEDCYGKIEGYKNYHFANPESDSLFVNYKLLLVEGKNVPLFKEPSQASEVLQTVSDTFFISFTGAGSNTENGDNYKIIYSNDAIFGFVEDKYCHYYDLSLGVSFRKINGSWKVVKLYRTPGC